MKKLRFREKKLSHIRRGRIFFLLGIFLVSVFVFELILNYRETSEVTQMEDAQLPIVTMEAMGETMGELHGYRSEMDACYMRDTVVPLDESRVLPIHINTYGMDIQKITYEIRSTDTVRKIAETEITDFVEADDMIHISPVIENLVEEGEEYLLVLRLSAPNEDIHYYTRILRPQEAHEKECLDFVKEFHTTALSSEYEGLAIYLEPRSDAIRSLSTVTISSPLDDIGWRGFDGEVYGDCVIEMKDINSDYCAIEMYYTMKSGEGDSAIYYNVEEYFKVRYGTERIYLLDYERTMDEILDIQNFSITDNVIRLGAHVGELNYLSNETGAIVAFVQDGGLFEYNQNTGVLTRIFDFRTKDLLDPRTNYNEHDMLILNIDESGTMDFVVFGYMNAGVHEGECGINLFHYDAALGVAKEQAFISSTNSYQILRARFSDLLYISTKNIFYIMVDGTLLRVDLNTLRTTEVESSLADTQYASSKSSRYFAWIDDGDVSKNIHIMDLETEDTFDIEATESESLRPVDFIDEDFVYGWVKDADISMDAAGSMIYPMYKLTIQKVEHPDGNILKEYEKPGYYVTSATKEATTLILDRVTKAPGGYLSASEDTIRNTSGESNKEVGVALVEDDTIRTSMTITMADQKTRGKLRARNAGIALAKDMDIHITVSQGEEKYFSYVGSKVIFAGNNVQKAILAADEQMGIVVDTSQRYIWKRGKPWMKETISGITVGNSDREANSIAQCISAMMVLQGENAEVNVLLAQGETPILVLQNTLRHCKILDLTGCTMQEALYYVSLGNPVYARSGENEAVLIIGYDNFNITVFDPATGGNHKIGLNDSAALFESQGNVFISYLTEQ